MTIISRRYLTHVANKVVCHHPAALHFTQKEPQVCLEHKFKLSQETSCLFFILDIVLYLVLVHYKNKNNKRLRQENWNIAQLQASVVFKITRLMGVVMYDLTPTTPTSETAFD